MPFVVPRTGPCAPWIDGDDVAALPAVQTAKGNARTTLTESQFDDLCAESAQVASEILYELSGRIFTGNCGPETVRPLSRPTDADSRWWMGTSWGYGYSGTWGNCSQWGNTAVASHYGCTKPPEIELGVYPVTEIVQVLIDGVEIPSNEYELRDFKVLVRMRPTVTSTPTERYGWPTCQRFDLPDTQEGTFSVTFRYGQPPPVGGLMAARRLAEFFILPHLGDRSRFPVQTTQVQRQGVTATAVSAVDMLKDKRTGITEVDMWLLSVNPNRLMQKPRVYSPDVGRARRVPRPSVSGGS